MQDGEPRYAAGDRVRIRRDREFGPGPWPSEPYGTVVAHPLADDADGISRSVETTMGPSRFYWIVFDEPPFDTEGDGPYEAAEVLAKYLEPV
jgi:hypothetical protein